MKWALFIAIFFVSIQSYAGTLSPTAQLDPPSLGKSRRIISRSDLIYGHFIGLSASEVRAIKGDPAATKPHAWVYRQRLGPGAHSFRYSWVVKFKRGRVVEVEEIREAVGCILIPPPREWRSKS